MSGLEGTASGIAARSPVLRADLRAALARAGLDYEEIEAGDVWLVVVPRLGARILGAGVGEENALWVSPVFGANPGGQRTWIAPELGPTGYFGADEAAWRIPPELDPGSYIPVPAGRDGEGWRAWRTRLDARAADGTVYPIAITRAVRLVAAPGARSDSSLRAEFVHTLENSGTEAIDRRIGLWCIAQVPSSEPGSVEIALAPGRAGAVRSYFTPLPPGVVETDGSAMRIRVHGGTRWKLGLPAASSAGAVSFTGPSRVGPGSVRVTLEFSVDPRGAYLDGPPAESASLREGHGDCGDAVQVYNDAGTGAFAFSEIEAHTPAVRLAPGERQSFGIVMKVETPAR